MTFATLQRKSRPAWRSPSSTEHAISKSKPFVETGGGVYTHRVRSATLHGMSGHGAWLAIHCWCGQTLLLGDKRHRNTRFADEPSEGRPVCATCEGRAIGAGQVGSGEIAGRAVMFSPRGGE